MNKFIAFFLFALVASVSCADFGRDQTETEVETELLLGNEKLFANFCNDQASRIRNDATEYSRRTSSKVMEVFFGNVNDVTDEVINVQKEVVAQLTAQLAKPSAEVAENISENEIAELVQEGKAAIQQKDGVSGLLPAASTTLKAMFSAANSALMTRLAKIRSIVSGLNFFGQFENACKKVTSYEEEMEAALEEAKQQILSENEDEQVRKFVKGVTIASLQCLTTKTVVRVHGFCTIVQSGHQHFFKMLGMESPLRKE